MKTVVVNASPRKDWNTAEILQSAQKGAESVGAETEYFNLYDLIYTGCRSCLVCKLKDKTKGRCYWKDDLTPVIDKIFDAMSYDDGTSYYAGKVNVGIFYTMNAPLEFYEKSMKDSLATTEYLFSFLNGEIVTYPVCDTMQVSDYSKYNMNGFSQEAKERQWIMQFPNDLEKAFEIGAQLSGD